MIEEAQINKLEKIRQDTAGMVTETLGLLAILVEALNNDIKRQDKQIKALQEKVSGRFIPWPFWRWK